MTRGHVLSLVAAVTLAAAPSNAAPPVPAAPSARQAAPRPAEGAIVSALTRTTAAPVAVLARPGTVSTSASGPPLRGTPAAWAWSPAEEELVDTIGARPLRIVTDTGTVRLVLHADPAALGTALARRETLRPSPGGAPSTSAFVELASGAVVSVLETRGDGRWLRVAYADPFRWRSAEVVTGWVPKASVAGEVRVVPFPDATSTAPRIADVEPGADLLDAPAGRALVTFPTSSGTRHVFQWATAPLGPPVRDHLRVAYVSFCDPRVRLVGWVASAKVKLRDNLGGGGGCGSGTGGPPVWGSLERAPRQRVAADRWLLDPASGDLLGRVVHDVELARASDGTLHVATKFGPVPVALAPVGWSP